MEILKRQVKRITSIILIITILVGVLPNFGLLKETKAASESEAKMIVRPGELDESDKEKGIFKVDIWLNNVDETGSTLYLKYPSTKMTPCDASGNIVTTATGKQGTNAVKTVITNGETMGFSDNGDDFFVNTETGELYCAFSIGTRNITSEIEMCTIMFKIKDSVQLSDVSNADFNITSVTDDESYYTSIGEIYADENPNWFSVEGFQGASVQSLSITTNPTEGNKYIHGKEIDLTGLELTATYTDNSTKTISMTDPELKITTGEIVGAIAYIENPQIIFEYKGKTTTLDVTVIDPVVEIEVIDEDKVLMNGIDSGNDIPTDEEGLYINATTASGKTSKILLSDTRINLSSYTADINAVPDDKKQNAGGGMYTGFQTITVTYQDNNLETDVTTTFDILVNDTIGSIKISTTNPPTDSFTIGDTFTKSGAITVVGTSGITYGDIDMSSDSVKVTELDCTAVDLTNITPRNLLVTFGVATVEYPITVQNKVASIRVNQDKPIKLKYDKKINEQQSAFAGITITEIMADGTDGDTKNLEFTWLQNTNAYDTNIYEHALTVNYPHNGKVIEGEILVSTIEEVTGIRVENLKTDYVYKNELDYKGAEVYIDYVSGWSNTYKGEEILDLLECTLEDDYCKLTVTGFDSTKIENNQKITFTYTEEESEIKTAEVFVNIGKATLEVPECEQLEIYEGKTISTIADQLPPTDEYGSVIWKDSTQTLTYAEGTDNIHEIDATYKMNATYAPYYNDVDLKVKVKVLKREVASIEITNPPADTEYIEGQTFNPTGMEITVNYNDGGTSIINSDYATKGVTFTPSTSLQYGTTAITVSYGEKTATQAITVEKDYVTSITVSYPNNFQQIGHVIDLTNTKITKVWASGLSHGDEDTEAVISSMVSNSEALDANKKFKKSGNNIVITVTYDNGKTDKPTATFNVNVEDAIGSITINDINTTYWVEDKLDSNLEITINYLGATPSKTIKISDAEWNSSWIKGIDMSKPGTYTLKIAYGNDESLYPSKEITVKDYIEKIKVKNNKSIYKLNENGTFNIEVTKYFKSNGNLAGTVNSTNYTLSPSTLDTTSTKTQDVTVSYENEKNETLTATFNVQVINATEKAILETTPTTMPEKWGDELNLAGASIKVKKQDGTYDTITLPNDAITVSAYNKNTLNSQTISFTYKYTELNEAGIEVEKTMPVEGVLNITLQDYWTEEIRVSGIPTTSIKGQELDLTNAKVSKVMASGVLSDTTSILGSMISNFDKNAEGTQTITVTNWGKSTNFNVKVTDNIIGISMNKQPNKTEYTQGEAIDVTGAVLNVTKQSGIVEIPVTKEMISGYDSNKVGQQVIAVNYGGFTTSFVINVKAKTTDKPVTPTKPNKPTKPNRPTKPTTPSTPSTEEPIVPEEIKKYLVTFVNYDGTILKTEEVESGKSATEPKAPTRKGYKFIGWSKDFDIVEEDMEIRAQYEKITTIKESPKPTEVLGEKDEVKEDNKIMDTLVPATVGLAITGFLLLLISALTKKNVEVYAIYGEEKKLIGREKISKRNNKILLDSYKSSLENATAIELRINEKTVEKLDGEIVEVIIDGKTKKYKMTDIIVMKK